MLVVPNRKKLVLNTPQRAAILDAIPHAREMQINGRELVAVEHGVEETLVLRNLGFRDTPAPILHYYDWPGRVTAMDHQRQTAAFFTLYKRGLCLNAPGTGKTLSALWAADYLLATGMVKHVAIVAPSSTVQSVWGKEIMQHLCHRRFELVLGDRKRRLKKLERDVDFFIINHDGFTTHPGAFAHCDLIIYDEATALKTPGSKRYKTFAKHVKEHQPWLWLMTGTPISQSPENAWTLSKLVNSPYVPSSFTRFKDMVMAKVSTFKWVPRPEALDICRQVMQPAIRYSLEECTDLPQTTFITRRCELTKAQTDAYTAMQAEAMLKGQNISAANAAVMFQKLLQIACGVAYADDGERVRFDDGDRIDALLELLVEIGDSTIIYVPLRGVQDRVAEVLQDKNIPFDVVNGSVPQKDRSDIFARFQNSASPRVLLAHPAVASHGLTLTRSTSIIWYAPIHSLELYEQANARIRRLSTEGHTVIYHLAATGFELELYRRLKQRKQVLANFLALVQGTNDDY